VEVGNWQGDNWFIFEGLSAGDRVITDGIIRLANGTPVRIVDKDATEQGKPHEGAGKPASTSPDKPGNAGS
jgi:membrane fusion protein (multidrug efflux system)